MKNINVDDTFTAEEAYKIRPERCFEKEPKELKISVKIQNLFKVSWLLFLK